GSLVRPASKDLDHQVLGPLTLWVKSITGPPHHRRTLVGGGFYKNLVGDFHKSLKFSPLFRE
ncbi:hypothetical protein STEG23_005449, partial [Scotinomys teguina]